MNKNSFDSYLLTIMTIAAAQQKNCTDKGLSKHTIISEDMCFESMMCMCTMMMS
ncbi:hypothetical protein H3Z85_22350 [Chryseobacterium indologenes]|uniref:hypothetical protein n=1 Tax=Chryseobacterium indologenes TaxID=253 RepID=UPI0004B891B8|nr:hypothetical protein [Chryseobacterium indologenes]QPQ51892.1 hypothetical protein H3Z85_22350 [Chryseobacterium indologenes]SFI65757.1 hypothetical protein SAMN05421692_0341 [Chryseobacterium indologenes]SUX50448.1 Uncharacterised protein [Chryseobacterium indologenes]